MEIRTLEGIPIDELLHVFNEAFSNYFVPLHLTHELLNAKLKMEKINLDYSVGTFADNKLVGFILHGFDHIDDKKVIYNGGTGVIPHERNHGLTKKMYDFIIPVLRSEGIDFIILEVISQNTWAIKSYEKVGFVIERRIVCYRGEMKTTSNEAIVIKELPQYDWERIRSFWDVRPTWQNSKNVLEEIKDTNKAYGAFIEDQFAGYVIYNPVSKRIQQFATSKEHRRKKVASTLLGFIGKEHGNNVTIINVDSNAEATDEFLRKIGLESFIEQLEMKLELKQ